MEDVQKRKQIASDLLGEIDWNTYTAGYCTCPGKHLHSTKASRRDCRVTIDGAPTIYCVHDSCSEIIAEKNRELRSKIGASEPTNLPRIPKIPSADERRRQSLRRRAEALKSKLFASDSKYAGSHSLLVGSSPLVASPEEQAHLLFSLFEPDDIIWSGDKCDSGKPIHARCFRSVAEWQKATASFSRLLGVLPPYGPFVVPSAFKADSISRSKNNVLHARFLVVESDVLDHENFCRVVNWLKTAIELPLRTIISTGGKSLHAWFDHPPPEILYELRFILPVLGCDEKMFNPAQPCRLPGVMRPEKGRLQEMLHFNKI